MSDLEQGRSKRCTKCLRDLPRSAFGRHSTFSDGLQYWCKGCYAENYRKRQLKLGKTVREKVDVPDGHKRCSQCKEIKPQSEWRKNNRAKDGLHSECKECAAKRGRRDYFKRTHGLTPEQVEFALRIQLTLCQICYRQLTLETAHLDHDHKTGELRAILCFKCNSALGNFDDDPERMRRAARYVEGDVWPPIKFVLEQYPLPS